MLLNRSWARPAHRFLLFLLVALIALQGSPQPRSAWAQSSSSTGEPSSNSPSQDPSGGIVWQICSSPPLCFSTPEARQSWAEQNNCRFLEDVCEQTTPGTDNQGAKEEDKGFWGGLWSDIKEGLVYGYEFVKGLLAGLKDQVADILDLITNAADVVSGLIDLGKAFYKDPKGTLATLAELFGQEAVDAITRATQCGAYDLGKVIGQYVSPAVMLKLATRLKKFGGKLADAVKATKRDLGCASFAAGTLVLTAQGAVPIESIAVGQDVLSRHERSFADRAQPVTQTFGRTAQTFWQLRTEFDTFKVTAEHPLWVQGKGWTEVRYITDEDVIAGRNGDVLVLGNEEIRKPLRVYNFSVAQTPSYFVGDGGLWVHNAKCDLTRVDDIRNTKYQLLGPNQKGFRGELEVRELLEAKGYTVVKAVGKNDGAFEAWQGQRGIDGIYKDKDGNYIIVESKATGGVKPSDPQGCVAGLCMTGNSGRQMSKKWIRERIEGDKSLSKAERDAIIGGLDSGQTKRVYAQTDENGTDFYEVVDRDGQKDNAELGGEL